MQSQIEESWFKVAKEKIAIKIKNHILENKKKYILFSILFLILLFLLRAYYQPLFLTLREYSFVFIYALGTICFIWLLNRLKVSLKVILPLSLFMITTIVIFILVGGQRYLALYFKYNSLNIVNLDTLPITDFERVQPIDSIYVQASEKINETESISRPDLAIIDGKYRWVMEIYPTYFGQKLFDGSINELFCISATTPTPDFSSREKVSFVVGEHLLLGKNAKSVAIKSLNPLKYLSYFPTDVKRLKDDNGEWVEVISLAKWSGVFFPNPEFAGVHIIRQIKEDISFTKSLFYWFKRVFLGVGEYISPSEIKNHKFLRGQNLNSYIVSRNIANSFKFQRGIFGPLKTYHEGDIRIPDIPGDKINQPFVVHFDGIKQNSGLYHYFGLEPYDKHKHGLSVSLFIPSDGSSEKIYVYNHSVKKESLTGASAIATKVMESKKNYDWSKNRPVENRPFIKKIDDKIRFFWLTTIATINEEGNMAGSIPEIVITDASTNLPIWVDSKNSDSWIEVIEKELSLIHNN